MAGVIVITTKKGKQGNSSFSYTGEFTTRLKPNYRTFNIMDSQDQMGIYQELQEKGWLNFASIYRASNSSDFPTLRKQERPICGRLSSGIQTGLICFSAIH